MEKTKEELEKQNTEDNKVRAGSKKKIAIISIVTILIIMAIAVSIYFITKKDKVKFNGESNGIKYSAKIQENSEVLVVMQNKTGKTVSELELMISYYDAEGNELIKKTETIDVYLKDKEISLNSIKSGIVNTNRIDSYKIEINPKYYEGEDKLSNYEKIEISELQEKEDCVAVDVRNTVNDPIKHVCFYAVFFKDGVPIDFFAKDVYNLDEETKNIEFKKPEDKDDNKIEYDFCKVYIKY